MMSRATSLKKTEPPVDPDSSSTKERLLQAASEELEIAPDDLEVVDGLVRARGAPDTSIAVEELASKTLLEFLVDQDHPRTLLYYTIHQKGMQPEV